MRGLLSYHAPYQTACFCQRSDRRSFPDGPRHSRRDKAMVPHLSLSCLYNTCLPSCQRAITEQSIQSSFTKPTQSFIASSTIHKTVDDQHGIVHAACPFHILSSICS